jgi:hypothetical protein
MRPLTDYFSIWWLKSARYRWSKLRCSLFEKGFLARPLPAVNSLQDIETCLQKVDWKMDCLPQLFDCVSYPQRVWDKKRDDCDGFAILSCALLSGWSPDTNPLMITAMVAPIKNSHSVCVFKQNNYLWYFSNKTLVQRNFSGYQEIVADFTSGNRLICWDVVKPDTLKALEFHVV